MKDFVIFTDSTSDLERSLREKYDLRYLPMNFVVDGVEHKALLDWEEISAKEFYDLMRNGKRIKTTQIGPEYTEKAFEEIVKEGKGVLYVACSSALSGSFNFAKTVAKTLTEKYPDAEIYCFDSLASTFSEGSLAMKASEMRAKGRSLSETVEELEKIKLTYNYCATVGTLEYLRRSGRIKASKAFFGNIFGVKPIIISDAIGQNYAYKKVKGSKAAKQAIAQDVAAGVIDPENQTLYISHADSLEDAEELRDEILKLVKFKDVYINYIGPIVGASVGPGTIIACYVGKEMTIVGKE